MSLLLALNLTGFFKGLIFVLFVLSALLLMLIVLLQEPKGGGLSGAFGGAGAETFGVQTGGVNKFTSYVAGIFIVLAVIYAAWRPAEEQSLSDTVPLERIDDPNAPAGSGNSGNSGSTGNSGTSTDTSTDAPDGESKGPQ